MTGRPSARGRSIASFSVLAVLAAALLRAGSAVAEGPCTADGGPGGDWPMYGHDLSGTRNQTEEHLIGPANVASLEVAWVAPASANSGNSTPVAAGRCVYVGGAGLVSALDITTGQIVWQRPSEGSAGVRALAVANGRVHASVELSPNPVGQAFNADTGEVLWTSEPISFAFPAWQLSSPILFDGIHILPTTGPDADPKARPGVALLDAATGATLHKQTVIPTEDLDAGYAGGGIWATPVVDPATGHMFVGTAQPYSKKIEHRYDNAIVKIDVARSRPETFGTVVGAYKGNVDQYFPGLDRQPACDMFGETITYHPSGFSVTCAQLDIDFGGSPTVFRNKKGELLVGELQKSGIFHTVYAATMQQAWTTIVSTVPPATAGNASSAANDGTRVYVPANASTLFALDPDSGRVLWVTAGDSELEYHPASVANGVVYLMGGSGILHAYDASSGVPLWKTSVLADAVANGGAPCAALGGGVAIAHNKVIANCDGTLVAYRLP